MSEQYAEGTVVDVSFTVRLSAPATYDEIAAWVKFEAGASGSIATSNPLYGQFEAEFRSVLISPRGSPVFTPVPAEA